MATFEKFEDIEAWQRARNLVRELYKYTSNGKFERDFALRDQVRRAAISIMLNIAEGFARRSDREFGQFLFIAHGSVAEVQSALYIAADQEYIGQEDFKKLYDECEEISRILSGLIKYLRLK